MGSWSWGQMLIDKTRGKDIATITGQAAARAPQQAGVGGEAPVATKKKKAGSYRSVLTSPLGIGGQAAAAKKTLLGQ